MPRWEYKVVTVTVLDIGDLLRHRAKGVPLDPAVSEDDWLRRTWKAGRRNLARVAWSDRGCWTAYGTCLREHGEEGWELVGATPPLQQYVAAGREDGSEARYPDFWLTFKRPAA